MTANTRDTRSMTNAPAPDGLRPGRRPARPGTSMVSRGLKAAILPLLVVIAWGLAVRLGAAPSYLLPGPDDVVMAMWTFLFGGSDGGPYSGTFVENLLASGKRVGGGFLLGSSLAIPLGVVLGHNRRMAAFVEPTLELFRAVPGICWLPLALIWFGVGDRTSIFLIALGSFYAVLISTTQGVKYVDRTLLRAALTLGASPRSLLHTVVLPAALPSIFSGLRIGLAYSWIYMVLGEFTGVNIGLGATLIQAREILRTDLIMGLMVIIGILGVLSDRLVVTVMRRLLKLDIR